MTVRIGLLLPTREAAQRGEWNPRRLIDLARRAERFGFDSLWTGDSLLATPRLEPLTLLSAIATATSTITVGAAALLAPMRHPLLAAHSIATLDHISEGRLIVALGAGFPYPATQAELAAVGVPYAQRHARLLETVRIWRMLWNPEHGARAFTGKHWHFTDLAAMPPTSRAGGPPLWYAGAGPRGLRVTGELFDGWLPYSPSTQDYHAGRAAIAKASIAAGRDPSTVTSALYLTVNVNDDADRARAELTEYTQAYYRQPLTAVEKVQAIVHGPAATCRTRLAAYVNAGAEHVIIRIGALGDPTPRLERLADVLLDG